jgi:hypothetical protein
MTRGALLLKKLKEKGFVFSSIQITLLAVVHFFFFHVLFFMFFYLNFIEIMFYIFFQFIFYRVIQTHDPDHGFNELTRVFLINAFQFHPSILNWLRIKFHDLFWFTSHRVIFILWLISWVWYVNLSWSELFFYVLFLINIFLILFINTGFSIFFLKISS